MTGEIEALPDDLIAESFDHGVWGASAGLNSAMFHTCMICGAAITERRYDPPINRRRHLRWHQQTESALSGSRGASDV